MMISERAFSGLYHGFVALILTLNGALSACASAPAPARAGISASGPASETVSGPAPPASPTSSAYALENVSTADEDVIESGETGADTDEQVADAQSFPPEPWPERTDVSIPPMDLSRPPADALSSPSGMAYKILSPATGSAQPGVNDSVEVTYTGWRSDNKMFYTSTRRGSPQPMALSQVSLGWQEALMDMREGERRLYWMSPKLASLGAPTNEQEPLIFEIELVAIRFAPPPPPNLKAPPKGAKRERSGLAHKRIVRGTGRYRPHHWDQVSVHYTLWDTSGRMVESTRMRDLPRSMQLFREAKWWSESVQKMVEGERRRVWVPERLRNPEKVKKSPGDIVADLELISVKKLARPPRVPRDVARPPRRARTTGKGVPYRILRRGKGKIHPTAASTVKVHYTGWTTDGTMFDSSIVRGQPARFPLRRVIAGWTDVVQVMVVGQKIRTWIPEALAYKGKPNRPQGVLVFDIELLEIDP